MCPRPDPVEVEIVREIFDTYTLRGLGLKAIAQRLDARGVPAPRSLRRGGVAAWGKGTAWTVVRNAIYVGRLVFGEARF